MDILRNMFSPQKPADSDQAQRASPLVEGHPNRVQKPRQKNKVASRKGASRAPRLPARILGSPELGEERDQEPSKMSRRHSEFPRASARLNDLLSDDDHNQTITEGISVSVTAHDDDGADSSIGFASQPAHLRSLLNSGTPSGSSQDEIVASTDPDEEMPDALEQQDDEEEDEDVVIGLAESEQDEKDSEMESESKIKSVEVEAKDDVSAVTSEVTPAPVSEPAPEDDAPDAAELDNAEAEDEEEEEGDLTINRGDGQHSFTDILEHRWSGDEIELKVGWYHGSPTWEPETILHADAPESLFAYWRSQGGRPANPRDADIFDIFAIRNHSRDKKSLFVEWTGYEPKENNSWVPSSVVQDTAPEVVTEYWNSIKKTPKSKTVKAKAPSAKATKAKTSNTKTSNTKTTNAKTSKAKTTKAKTSNAKTSNAKVTKTKAPARRKK